MRVSLLLVAALCFSACALSVSGRPLHHQHQRTHHASVKSPAAEYTPAALADQVHNLPGLAQQPSFNHFSGYLVVNTTTNKSLHYWYVESQGNPSTDPLIWWSNGGPGCSGLLGMLTEHGPWRPSPDGETMVPYEYSWNRLANVMYIEAPAGVGFSFSQDPSDYTIGDNQTAIDNYLAIEQFFIRFPNLRQNEFFLASESYGGHYVPQLANQILAHGDITNFKGFLLGNPLTDDIENQIYGSLGTMCGHSLASYPSCLALRQHCQENGQDSMCAQAQQDVMNDVGNMTYYDPYGLDYPICHSTTRQARRYLTQQYQYHTAHGTKHAAFYEWQLRRHGGMKVFPSGTSIVYDPCTENEETVYLSRPDVQAALHISQYANLPWMSCASPPNPLNYNQNDGNRPEEPYYTEILAYNQNLRLVVFSGDDDTICGSLGTQYWMYNLFGNDITTAWTQWMYNSDLYGQQIGGSVVQFQGISFVTIHSAGHDTPTYQPERAFALLQNYLAGAFTSTSVPTQEKKHHKKLVLQ